MKRVVAILMVLTTLLSLGACGAKEENDNSYTVGICQLMVHDALDQATQGFQDALKAEMEAAGKTVEFDVQVAREANLCTTVINTFTAKKVDLIMANATPALLAAARMPTLV